MSDLKVIWEADDGEAFIRLLWSPDLGYHFIGLGDERVDIEFSDLIDLKKQIELKVVVRR